jgi:methionyl-tRNA formyltransferase
VRVVVVTSDYVTDAKRRVAVGLGSRLVGVASVPVVPPQVGFWRHVCALATVVGPAGLPGLAVTTLMSRVSRLVAALGVPGRFSGARGLARTLGVSYRRASGPGDPRLLAWMGALGPDLVVSLQSHRVPEGALGIPRLGWLNLHHGRLPDFRGAFSVFWAMRTGERILYATAHLMGSRLDDGPVVVEEPVPVVWGASVADMETRMWAVSPRVLLTAVDRLETDAAAAVAEPRGAGRYYTYPTRRDIRAARLGGLRVR